MEKVQQETLRRALMMLSGSGCAYIVRDADGQTHLFGSFETEKRRTRSYEHAERLGQHVNYHLKDIQIGDVRLIPLGDFDKGRLHSRVTAVLTNKFGKGSFTTVTNKEKGAIEALRLS